MNEIQELYQQVILDHNKNPRNFGAIEHPSHFAEGHNPLCGDHLDLYMNIEEGIIKEVRFNGSGCAISKASASVMTTILKNKTITEAQELFKSFQEAVTSDTETLIDEINLGKLAVFCGVREFPARVKCASLPWHTLINALEGKQESSIEIQSENHGK
ncbi:MAG: NifU-like protein [Ignavibacteria bacterium]|nr:NifU-like protein [Ignavibacteria bacterium]